MRLYRPEVERDIRTRLSCTLPPFFFAIPLTNVSGPAPPAPARPTTILDITPPRAAVTEEIDVNKEPPMSLAAPNRPGASIVLGVSIDQCNIISDPARCVIGSVVAGGGVRAGSAREFRYR